MKKATLIIITATAVVIGIILLLSRILSKEDTSMEAAPPSPEVVETTPDTAETTPDTVETSGANSYSPPPVPIISEPGEGNTNAPDREQLDAGLKESIGVDEDDSIESRIEMVKPTSAEGSLYLSGSAGTLKYDNGLKVSVYTVGDPDGDNSKCMNLRIKLEGIDERKCYMQISSKRGRPIEYPFNELLFEETHTLSEEDEEAYQQFYAGKYGSWALAPMDTKAYEYKWIDDMHASGGPGGDELRCHVRDVGDGTLYGAFSIIISYKDSTYWVSEVKDANLGEGVYLTEANTSDLCEQAVDYIMEVRDGKTPEPYGGKEALRKGAIIEEVWEIITPNILDSEGITIEPKRYWAGINTVAVTFTTPLYETYTVYFLPWFQIDCVDYEPIDFNVATLDREYVLLGYGWAY